MKGMKRGIIILSLLIVYGVFGVLSFLFARERSFLGIITAFTEYYGIYCLVLPAGVLILHEFDGMRNPKQDSTKLLIGGMISFFVAVPLLYFVDHFKRVSLLDAPLSTYGVSVLFRFCLSLFLTYGICRLCKLLLFCNEKQSAFYISVGKVKNLVYGGRYGIGIFVVFLVKMYLNSDGNLNSWATVWYAMNYGDGVSSRLLVGTLLSLLTGGGFISEKMILATVYLGYLVIILCLSVMMGTYLNRAGEKEKTACMALVALYLVMPGNIGFLWTAENMGRVETFVLAFLLLFLLLAEKVKNSFLKYVLYGVATLLCMATYQAYLFLYFPMLFAVMVYNIVEQKGNKKNFVGMLLVCLCTAGSFLYFQFCSSIHYDSLEELYQVLCQRTDMEISEMALECEFFGSIKNSWYLFFEPMIVTGNNEYLRERGFVNATLLFPVLLVVLSAWKCIWDKAGVKNWKMLLGNSYFWMTLANLLILVQFVLTMDWGRWFSAALGVQFFELMYLGYRKDPGIREFQEKFSNFIRSHKWLCLMVLIYLASLSPMEAAFQTEDSRRIMRNISKIFASLF